MLQYKYIRERWVATNILKEAFPIFSPPVTWVYLCVRAPPKTKKARFLLQNNSFTLEQIYQAINQPIHSSSIFKTGMLVSSGVKGVF